MKCYYCAGQVEACLFPDIYHQKLARFFFFFFLRYTSPPLQEIRTAQLHGISALKSVVITLRRIFKSV